MPDVTPKSWEEFKREFLSLYAYPLRAKATCARMRSICRLLDGLGISSTADLTVSAIAELVKARPQGQSTRTVNGMLRALRTLCNHAVNAGYLARSPFLVRPVGSWVRMGPPRVKRHLSRDEIRRLLDLMRQDSQTREGWAGWRARRLEAVTVLICYTGLRRNEALFLRGDDLDLDQRIVYVRDNASRRLKTESSSQPVPLPPAAVPILREWLTHRLDRPPGFHMPDQCDWLFPNTTLEGPWSEGSPGVKPLDRLQAVAHRARIEGVTFHALRRSLATHLEGSGVGQALITRILRHTSEGITQRYYQGSDVPNLRQAVTGFSYYS